MKGSPKKRLPPISEPPSELCATRSEPSASHVRDVVAVIRSVCGASHLGGARDLESTILARLWRDGGFGWPLNRVRNYTLGALRLERAKGLSAKVRPESEFANDDDDDPIRHFRGVSRDDPFISCWANEARGLLARLPNRQGCALDILAEGGTPIDVATEMGMPVADALLLIADARRNIHLLADDDDV
jgi:hypothetical protein